MCLAIPGILLSVRDGVGEIDYGGLSAKADLTLTPEAKPGDRLIVHAGFAIAVLSRTEGDELMRLVEETRSHE